MTSKMVMIRFSTSLVLAFAAVSPFPFSEQAVAANNAAPKTSRNGVQADVCVASLLADAKMEKQIVRTAFYYLSEGRSTEADPPFPFVMKSGGVEVLRSCLEGPYKSVVFVAHSFKMSDRFAVLGEPTPNGGRVIASRTFANLRVSPSVKRLTIVTCFADEVLQTYPLLVNSLSAMNIEVTTPPPSPASELLTGVFGVRSASEAGIAIARDIVGPTFQENFK